MGVKALSRFKVQRPWFLCFFSLLLPSPHLCFPLCPSTPSHSFPFAVPPQFESQAASVLKAWSLVRDAGPALPCFSLAVESCVQAALALCGHLWRLQSPLLIAWLFWSCGDDGGTSDNRRISAGSRLALPGRQEGLGCVEARQVHRWNNGAGICLPRETSEHDPQRRY